MFKAGNLSRILIFCVIPLCIFILGFFLFCYRPALSIFPNDNILPTAYTDTYDKTSEGHSQINEFKISETEINMSYTLRKGVPFPYAGISFRPAGFLINLQPYDEIEIAVNSTKSETLRLFILLEIDGYSYPDEFLSYLYLYKEIPVWQKKKNYHLRLADFKTPEWWYDINNRNELDPGLIPDFSKTFAFVVERPADLPLNITDRISLTSFLINKNLLNAVGPLFLFIFLYYFICGFFLIWLRYKKRLGMNNNQPNLSYSQVKVRKADTNEEARIMEYLFQNFHFPDLSVKKVCQACSVPAYKIPVIIKQKTRLSFPAFINSIRLNHAKKLLEKSDMAIIDIAMESGFSNISHFNKVFRSFESISPRNYRKKVQSKNE